MLISHYIVRVLWHIVICLKYAFCFREKTENETRLSTRLKDDLIELTEEEFNHVTETVIIPMQRQNYKTYCCRAY